ncbi:MAG: hypothetical protein K2V38_01175 [Gemmataceae bacterium]|nr:hypothetical protein [Gemmataceae bacterium]
MFRASLFALCAALLVLATGLNGQEPKKDDKKPDDKKVEKKDDKKDTTKDEGKLKGTLPPNWKKLGLTEKQVQEVYKVQAKYRDEIDKLEAKIRELKAAREKEEKAVLTDEQKKRLEDILTGKDK